MSNVNYALVRALLRARPKGHPNTSTTVYKAMVSQWRTSVDLIAEELELAPEDARYFRTLVQYE